MERIFGSKEKYYSRYYSQKGRRLYLGKLQQRAISGYKEAEELGILQKSRFYGEDLGRLDNEQYKRATKKQMESEIRRLEQLFVDKKRTDPKWLSRHQGIDAHNAIKVFFDTHPDKSHDDYFDIYDVFDEIEAEEEQEI